jgi:hypothetical protein
VCARTPRTGGQQIMPQIFSRSANALARTSLATALIVIGTALFLLMVAIPRSGYVTRANTFVDQPVQFSHLHHVADDGIDCRYCHTSVESSAFAGIPPTKTCMSCHSQIWADSPYLEPVRASFREDEPIAWTRVHDQPDFVYFNHRAHLNKGVGCESCHGRVDQMPLMLQAESLRMEWCLDCHRAPENHVRPKTEIFTMGYEPEEPQAVLGMRLVQEYGIAPSTSCSTCHR